MPIYEYRCEACGERTEQLMRMSDPDPVDCPACGAPSLKRALTAPAFRLAGSGWYETDFKGEKDRKRNLAGDGVAAGDAKATDAPRADAKSDSKSDSKSDAKPAAAPAASPSPASTPTKPAGS